MEAKIKVNLKDLSVASNAVNVFYDKYKANMQKSENEVLAMGAFWQGDDYDLFLRKWHGHKEDNSAYNIVIREIKSYADYLEYAADEYDKARDKCVNESQQL